MLERDKGSHNLRKKLRGTGGVPDVTERKFKGQMLFSPRKRIKNTIKKICMGGERDRSWDQTENNLIAGPT